MICGCGNKIRREKKKKKKKKKKKQANTQNKEGKQYNVVMSPANSFVYITKLQKIM